MAYALRSAHVVGAHYFARFGYEEAMQQISSKLMTSDKIDHSFWAKVLEEVEKLNAEEEKGLHPCAALPPKPVTSGVKRNVDALKV